MEPWGNDPWESNDNPWEQNGDPIQNENDIFNSIQRSRAIGDPVHDAIHTEP